MIKLDQLTKSFGENEVLKGITLHIEKGEIFGLIGKNGAGKTTLLSIIAGLSDATGGTCTVNGRCCAKATRTGSVGYLPDVPAFFDLMTTDEYLDFLFMGAPDHKKKRDALLKFVGLSPKVVIKTMSRGMRQRLGMAATLVNDPDVILLDEPSSALDPMGRYELSQILLHLKQQGKTIILSTHILTDMESVCDRVGFLHNGIIVKTLCPQSADSTQKLVITFRSPVAESIFDALPLHVTRKSDTCFVLSGDLRASDVQKSLLTILRDLEEPITAVNTTGADLDEVFREVCL